VYVYPGFGSSTMLNLIQAQNSVERLINRIGAPADPLILTFRATAKAQRVQTMQIMAYAKIGTVSVDRDLTNNQFGYVPLIFTQAAPVAIAGTPSNSFVGSMLTVAGWYFDASATAVDLGTAVGQAYFETWVDAYDAVGHAISGAWNGFWDAIGW